jgi:hypothetical protein
MAEKRPICNYSGVAEELRPGDTVPASENGYTIFGIWAEENADLGATSYEWAYGNGTNTSNGNGIVLPTQCELFAMGLNMETATSATVRAVKNTDDTDATYQIASTTQNDAVTFPIPLSFSAGDVFNFYTVASGGGQGSARAVAWFRIVATQQTGGLIGDLTDVDTTGLSSGQFLQWNGSQFLPKALASSDVGLGNCDNTSDANKPISTATQTALNLKANLAAPSLTGNATLDGDRLTSSADVYKIVEITQAAYDALGTPDTNTLYVVVG